MTAVVDGPRLRQVMGAYPTGVTVVTAVVDGAPVGMAVNSFTSVSLDPPLVSFCPARTSSTWAVMRRADVLVVNVLGRGQDEVCWKMARKGADRFDGVAWRPGPGGGPVIEGCIAWLECAPADVFPGGDHEIVVARVTSLDLVDGAPLVFHRGALTPLEVG